PDNIKEVLIEGTGKLAGFLNLASKYEMGEWEECFELAEKIKVNEIKLPEHFMDAVGWANAYSSV
ncbi:MAG: hypothetical protein GY852_10920, partial [bacterium]|nr:hypothetical protein [bacterium]